MKKTVITIVFITTILFPSLGMDGDGSSSNPFRGTLNTSETWSIGEFTGNIVYIGTSTEPDLTVTTDGHLTIDPGITVIFTQLTSDLIITGSGILTAEGTSTDLITFTKDPGKSHWGHISFEIPGSTNPMTGTGSFDYCHIEYGYADGAYPYPSSAGGGIQVNGPDVTIYNSSFNDNFSRYGGAVTVNASQNTIIKNSYFKSNDAFECGGGVLLHLNSTALVENCIFEDNHSTGTSSSTFSGGAIWSRQNTSKIINCTFVENNSDRSGDALYTYSSPGTKTVNCIFWGSADQFSSNGSSYTISNCAFETTKPASSVNSIVISDVASDHFVDAASSNWALKFISPCRDAGVNTYSGVTIPSADYEGNPRIGTKDIGTYEVQYSRWTGATSDQWAMASNWDQSLDPSSGTDVVIPAGLSNYPTGSTTQDFTLASGKQMIVEPGAKLTLDAFTNNGTFTLSSSLDQAGTADSTYSVILNSFSGNNADAELNIRGGYSNPPINSEGKWHYISIPFSTSVSTSVFAPAVTLDLARFYEDRPTATELEGWVAYDGYVYFGGGSDAGYAFSSLTTGTGYNLWNDSDWEFTISGALNTSDVTVPLGYSGSEAWNGFNLLGNPFSSGLDWDLVTADASYPANTSKGVYFTRNNVQCTYIGGVGTPSDVTGIIPPMQGFFTKTYAASNSIKLIASARTHGSIHAPYKGKSIIPHIRLQINDGQAADEAVVRFDEAAKTGLDYDFDAVKMFIDDSKPYLFTTSGGIKFAINGQPYPDAAADIPVTVNFTSDGTHTITATQLQGLDNYNVTLKDLVTGYVADLKSTPELTFTAPPGVFTDRFRLSVSSVTTGMEEITTGKGIFNVFEANGLINIQTVSDIWNGQDGSVRIYDMTGRIVNNLPVTEFVKSSMIHVPAPEAKGIYLVEMSSGTMRHVSKVMIR